MKKLTVSVLIISFLFVVSVVGAEIESTIDPAGDISSELLEKYFPKPANWDSMTIDQQRNLRQNQMTYLMTQVIPKLEKGGIDKGSVVEYFGPAHKMILIGQARAVGFSEKQAENLFSKAVAEKAKLGGTKALANFYLALDKKREEMKLTEKPAPVVVDWNSPQAQEAMRSWAEKNGSVLFEAYLEASGYVKREDLGQSGLFLKGSDGKWVLQKVALQADLIAAGILSSDGFTLRRPLSFEQLVEEGILEKKGDSYIVAGKNSQDIIDYFIQAGLAKEDQKTGEVCWIEAATKQQLIESGILKDGIVNRVATEGDISKIKEVANTALTLSKVNSSSLASSLSQNDREQFYQYCLRLSNVGISFSQVGITKEEVQKKGFWSGDQTFGQFIGELLKGFQKADSTLNEEKAKRKIEKLLAGVEWQEEKK